MMATFSDDVSTTGSYKNPDSEPPQKRKRGMARLLSDVSNLVDSDGRRSEIVDAQRGNKLAAKGKIKALVTPMRPRGDNTLGNQVKHSLKQETSTSGCEDKSLCVSQLLK